MVRDWESDEKKRRLGARLQFYREMKGLTQQQLADRAGCTKNYLSAIERGVNKLTVPLLLEYCDALRVTPNELLEFDDGAFDDEIKALMRSFEGEDLERAVRVLKALK